jgi:DNA-binding protein H-NS
MVERTRGVADAVNTNSSEKPASDKVDEVMRIVDTLDHPELLRLRDLIAREYTQKAEAAKARVIAEAREKFEQFGLSFEDVIASERKRKSTVRTPVMPKYMSPEGVPWSGRGATPKWMREIEEAGGNRDDYLINKA